MTNWKAEEKLRSEQYRHQIRKTMREFSDEALAFQGSIIVGGIDREECDREIIRRNRIDADAAASRLNVSGS